VRKLDAVAPEVLESVLEPDEPPMFGQFSSVCVESSGVVVPDESSSVVPEESSGVVVVESSCTVVVDVDDVVSWAEARETPPKPSTPARDNAAMT
jgi:hypothetical protein